MNLFLTLMRPFGNRGLGRVSLARQTFRFLVRYLVPTRIHTVKYDGLVLDIDGWAYPEMLISDGSRYTPIESQVFKGSLKEGMTVIDIGAAMGYYTLSATKEVGPSGKVLAFEPSPRNFQLLRRNVERADAKNVTLIECAIADFVGTSKLFLSGTNPLADSLGPGRPNEKTSIEVPVTTLDAYLKNTRVDFIKMNMEGAEPLALRGMQAILKNNPNLVMLVEFDPRAMKGLEEDPEDYLATLLRRFSLQVLLRKKNVFEPFKNLKQIYSGFDYRNGATLLLCRRRTIHESS